MLIQFNKPQNLNGEELVNELKSAGIIVEGRPSIDGEGNLWLDIQQNKKAAAEAIILAHNGTMVSPEPTIEQKLASVGLKVEDLKIALGLA